MRTISPLSGQSIFDIALMTCGVAEMAYDIALANEVGVTDDVENILLVIPEDAEKNRKVVEYYTINSVTPATDIEIINIVYDPGVPVDPGVIIDNPNMIP
ncbi:MAG: hypothetical protein LBI45_02160 [Bacteroidales bacterium]|jgi:hypothetical protein|nr:hypothetical protein [Bacteroidales bacterium]